MFRELTRKNRAIDKYECIKLLSEEKRGVLSVNGDGGYPYAMPMNHFYNEDDGCIYFHSGKSGHRLDALCASDKVCFCVCEEGERREDDWALTVRSVVVFGRLDIIDEMDEVIDISARLSRKFTDDEDYIRNEIEHFAKDTILLKLTPEHITGKRVREA